MRKIFSLVCILLVFMSLNAYALESNLLVMRNQFAAASKDMRTQLLNSRDALLINSMWDSCVVTLTQLDAYFAQLGIFNTIKQQDVTNAAVDYLDRWLNEIKQTNTVNISGLSGVTKTIDAETKTYVEKMKGLFRNLNTSIDSELKKVSNIRKANSLGKKR
jgi:hypothetical protein